jgi:uncharacterized phage protein gp47/JayE
MAEIRRYKDIMEQATANMIALQDSITDFNNGSNIHTLLDSVARIAERLYVAIRQGYNENLRLVPYSNFRFTRKEGTFAHGTAVFSRSNPLPSRTIIPSGTRISDGNNAYTTTEVGYIEPGNTDSNSIKIIATATGTLFNVMAHILNTIESAVPSDVVAVTNDVALTGGTDIESDTEFDDRFKIFINGLSGTNDYAIMSAVLELPIVRSVSIKNHKPPLRNIFNMSVYVDDGSGTATEETLAAAKLAIEGDGTAQHQGHLAPGVNIRVLSPQTVPVDFYIVAYVYRTDIQEAENEIRRVIADYVNSLTIGKSVIISEIISRLKQIPFVRDIPIKDFSPTENIPAGSDQIPRFGSAVVDVRETSNG